MPGTNVELRGITTKRYSGVCHNKTPTAESVRDELSKSLLISSGSVSEKVRSNLWKLLTCHKFLLVFKSLSASSSVEMGVLHYSAIDRHMMMSPKQLCSVANYEVIIGGLGFAPSKWLNQIYFYRNDTLKVSQEQSSKVSEASPNHVDKAQRK